VSKEVDTNKAAIPDIPFPGDDGSPGSQALLQKGGVACSLRARGGARGRQIATHTAMTTSEKQATFKSMMSKGLCGRCEPPLLTIFFAIFSALLDILHR